MEFSFRLTGTGWAEARVAHGTEWATIPASYLSDALGEVLLALVELQDGEDLAVASWEEEPGEYRWLFSRTDSNVTLRILAFRDSYPRLPDDDGSEVFSATCSLIEMARAFSQGARSVLSDEGEDGFQRKWVEYPFPTALLEAVESWLRAQ